MSFGTYRQYDSRWGKRNYNGSSNYAQAGCGPTSCANILHAINPSINPLVTGNWMKTHGYAVRNHGTNWNGIPACLKAYGAKDVREVEKMADIFSYCSKGYVGVFLFRAGTKGGVTWTLEGHFVAVTGYKHKNGKHYFRTFDSGGRKHDGFYCYESQMKGLVRKVWLCKVASEKISKPTGKYTGNIPTATIKKGSSGNNVKRLQKFLNWYHPAWKLTVDGKAGANTINALVLFQDTEGLTTDGVYGKKSEAKAKTYKAAPTKPTSSSTAKKTTSSTKTSTPAKKTATAVKKTNSQKILDKCKELAWAYGTDSKKYAYKTGAPKKVCKTAMKKYGWASNKAELSDCGNFASTVVREAGVDKSFKALHGVKTAFPKTEKKFNIVYKGKKITDGVLKPGDIVRYKKTNGKQHALIYYAKGKVCEASHKNLFGVIRKDTKRYNTQSKPKTIQVLRAKE